MFYNRAKHGHNFLLLWIKIRISKPLLARKRLINLAEKDGRELSRRWSPKRCTRLDMFHELIYFTRVFPHRRLTMRMPLIEIEEIRYPHKRRNRRRGQFKVQDQRLIQVVGEDVYRNHADLRGLLPKRMPKTFGTKEIADAMEIDRWFAQRIAYCLRKTGAVRMSGKKGNSLQYQFASSAVRKRPTRKKSTRKKAARKRAA